jgi:hypothetical protein
MRIANTLRKARSLDSGWGAAVGDWLADHIVEGTAPIVTFNRPGLRRMTKAKSYAMLGAFPV